MKRILIITDSLGLPVGNQADMNDIWTTRIIEKFRKEYQVLFFPKRGRTTSDILIEGWANDLLVYPKADIVVLQVGIVDCCRRVLPRILNFALQIIPLIGIPIQKILSHNHYRLTRTYNYKYVKEERFKQNIENIVNTLRKSNPLCKIAFIVISPPGQTLLIKTYNIHEDINIYNSIIWECSDKMDFDVINPYPELNNDMIMEDGHHLTYYGHETVYNHVCSWIEKIK